MEKGFIRHYTGSGFNAGSLKWFNYKTFKEYGKFPKSLFLKPDLNIYGTVQEVGFSDFEAYRCENCGAVLIIPPDNDYDRNF